jgi:hypothetical protein
LFAATNTSSKLVLILLSYLLLTLLSLLSLIILHVCFITFISLVPIFIFFLVIGVDVGELRGVPTGVSCRTLMTGHHPPFLDLIAAVVSHVLLDKFCSCPVLGKSSLRAGVPIAKGTTTKL